MAIIIPFQDRLPVVAADAFVASNVVLTGDVEVASLANVWFGSVLRGDVGSIRIGERSSVQDLCVLHCTLDVSNLVIEHDVTVGHSCVLHGCHIEAGALIGMGSLIMDNARIGAQSIIGAGTLVTSNAIVPPGSLVMGRPGKIVRMLAEQERQRGLKSAQRYLALVQEYRRTARCCSDAKPAQ